METKEINSSPEKTTGEMNIIIEIKLNNWNTIYPAYISTKELDYKKKIEDAYKFFTNKYDWLGIMETVIDNILFDTLNIKTWDTYKRDLIELESNDKVKKVLNFLSSKNVSSKTIDIVSKDLQVEDNIKLFNTYLDLSEYSDKEKELIKKSLDLAISAHEWQTQKRPQDEEWLDNIPYSNHPVQLAILAMRDLKMSPNEVIACLLHDVIEDTEIRREWNNLWKETYDEEVFNLIDDCTKKETETREEFMQRMKSLTGSSKLIKSLDRLHNMIRAFTINDPKYITKIINETKLVYLDSFENNHRLYKLQYMFFELLEELEKYLEEIK